MMFTLSVFSRLLTICFGFFLCWASVATAQTDANLTVHAQLLVAARQGDAEGVKKSLDRGAAPNSRNRLGKTTLFLAIEKNRMDIVQMMINAGGDVNLASLEKVTPLIAASYAGNADIVQLLIDKGAKLEEVDRLRKSALVYAAAWATPTRCKNCWTVVPKWMQRMWTA
jgi:hypothetical protein